MPTQSLLNVLMVVTGFPSKDKPGRGIFNLRAAQALRSFLNISVVHLRAWMPGRPMLRESEVDGIAVTTVTVPEIPNTSTFNVFLCKHSGWPLLRSRIQGSDLVHSVGALAGIPCSFWAQRARVHHLLQATGSDVNVGLPRIGSSSVVRGWHNYLHAVACNSQALAKAFLAFYPECKNVRTVWRGVDLDQFRPDGPMAGPLANRHPVRYFFLGGFPKINLLPAALRFNIKGGETLMAAWQAAEDQLIARGASLLIANCGASYDRVCRWRAGLKSSDRVHLTASIPPEMIPAWIRASDAVLIPSLQEGLPNVALEAAACGRPILASNVGGLSEVVLPEQTGLLLPAGDVAAWQRALVSYAGQPSLLRVMGAGARLRAEALFDARNYAPQMLELYQAALREPLEFRGREDRRHVSAA